MPTTEELTATVEALREEIERVRDKGFRDGSTPRGSFEITTVSGFTWCADPFCSAMDQQKPAVGKCETFSQTNRQRDPSSSWGTAGYAQADAVENSYIRFFLDPDESVCEVCGKPSLQFDPQERPRYERLNSEDPLTLLRRKRSGITPEQVIEEARQKAATAESDELKELRDQLARQQSMLAFVMGQQGTAQHMPPELVEMLTGGTPVPEPEEPSGSPVEPPAAASAREVKGWRKRGDNRYEALIYKSESVDGRQRSLGRFDTVEEAVAAREEALR